MKESDVSKEDLVRGFLVTMDSIGRSLIGLYFVDEIIRSVVPTGIIGALIKTMFVCITIGWAMCPVIKEINNDLKKEEEEGKEHG